MTDHDHQVDSALRRVAGDPMPSEDDRRVGRERLAQAIAVERESRQWRPGRLAATAIIGLVVIVALFAVLETLNPTPISAAFEEVAEAAEEVDPLTVPAQEYAYFSSEVTSLMIIPKERLEEIAYTNSFLVYLLPTIREVWIGGEGTVQIRTTNQTPRFFSDQDATVYYQAGLDAQDTIGETNTLTTSDEPTDPPWPASPEELDAAIRDAVAPNDGISETVQYLDVALGILRESAASPALRAATLRLIGQLPDLQFDVTDDAGDVTVSIEYVDQGIATRRTFTFSSQGALLNEEILISEPNPTFGIPAETAIFSATYDPPLIVDSLNPG